MKVRVIFATALFILCVPGWSQAQCSVAVLDSQIFTDPQNGITVMAQSVSHIEHDLQPRYTQLQQLRERYQSIIAEINKVHQVTGGNIVRLTQKVDEAKSLKGELENRSRDYEEEYNQRAQAIVERYKKSIAEVLQSIAKKRGYLIVLDRSKITDAIIHVAKECDVTDELVAEYNKRVSSNALSNNSLNPTPR